MLKKNSMPNLTTDLKSGFIVFLVALPLCLGIALASGVPLMAGLVAGIVGGIVVGAISDSNVSVSGPAAGLVIIILEALEGLNSYELLLTSICLAGCLQILFAILKLGGLSKWINHSVIEGMLAAIGVLIILKQLPYALGIDGFLGYSHIFSNESHININYGAFGIGLLSLIFLVIYNLFELKKTRFFQILPVSIVLVVFGTLAGQLLEESSFALQLNQFVDLGGITNGTQILSFLRFPDLANIFEYKVIKYGVIIAVVASIETLLCIQAGDKLDQQNRKTSPNRELLAQGFGNIISGALGGLPISSVIVRTSVNVESGAKTKNSTIFHGFWLLLGLCLIPTYITLIPLTVLACILLQAGFNLAHPQKIMAILKQGYMFYLPFLVTIIIVVFEDLLLGVLCGQILAFLLILYKSKNSKKAHELH